MKTFFKNLYEAIFNSKLTAIVCLIVLAGLAVQGAISLAGDNQATNALAIAMVVLLTNKVSNKVVE